MKKIGMIGGLAWPSTIDYYRLLCTRTNAHFQAQGATPPYPTPPMVIESLTMAETRKLRGKEGDEASWARYDEVFRATFLRLQAAGADFAIIASNTPHMRLHAIRKGLSLPIVSILDTTAAAVRALGGTRALVLGTPVTIRSPVYAEALRACGIEAMTQPIDEDIAELDILIDVNLCQADIGDTRQRIVALSKKYIVDPARDVICLACTELPLAFPEHQDASDFEVDGMRFVNTTAAHVEAILRETLS